MAKSYPKSKKVKALLVIECFSQFRLFNQSFIRTLKLKHDVEKVDEAVSAEGSKSDETWAISEIYCNGGSPSLLNTRLESRIIY